MEWIPGFPDSDPGIEGIEQGSSVPGPSRAHPEMPGTRLEWIRGIPDSDKRTWNRGIRELRQAPRSENTAIADTLLEARSTGKRQRCEVTLTLLEEVRTAKLGREIAERGVEFWRSQPRGTGDGA